jgi:ribosomal protein S18 acetylase RimI-like enzyme
MDFSIQKRLPSVEEFNYLRQLAEWPVIDPLRAKKGLENSLFGVCAVDSNQSVIGMGRIAGDDAIYLHILDVIVHPKYQRKGIGKMLMMELLKYAESVAGKNSHIGLMASKGREQFYRDLGFAERPNEKQGAGMVKVIG